jgi:hypothetical protein
MWLAKFWLNGSGNEARRIKKEPSSPRPRNRTIVLSVRAIRATRIREGPGVWRFTRSPREPGLSGARPITARRPSGARVTVLAVQDLISRSSGVLPAARAALNQSGRLPMPPQVRP